MGDETGDAACKPVECFRRLLGILTSHRPQPRQGCPADLPARRRRVNDGAAAADVSTAHSEEASSVATATQRGPAPSNVSALQATV
jgi:hypothetical protein